MSKKKSTKISLIIAIIIAMVTVSSAMAFAWFANMMHEISLVGTDGKVLTQYFHCGTGTADDPFVITRPIHYYNLVNLYQRIPVYSERTFYFQLGYEHFDGHEGEALVYKFDDDGNIATLGEDSYEYDTVLNLSCYDGSSTEKEAILPIGTHDRNFMGFFDGNGLTIKGFKVVGDSTSGECDIGIFGYVGKGANIHDVYYEDVTIDLSNVTSVVSTSSGNQTHNASAHVVDGKSVAYVGYIAGHIINPSNVENVYLNDVTIIGGGAATSNFSYFGYIENYDGSHVDTLGERIESEFGDNDNTGWGTTLAMDELFSRLYSITKKATTQTWATEEVIVKDRDTGAIVSRVVTDTDTGLGSHGSYDMRLRSWSSELGGSYTFNTSNGTNPWIYLTGLNEYQQKTVKTYITYEGDNPAYYICDNDGRYYLSYNSAKNVVAERNKDNAAKWVLDESNHLYTYIGVDRYYLTATSTNLSLSATATTTWTIGENGGKLEIYTVQSGTSYFLTYDDVWKLINTEKKFSISDKTGTHYIGVTSRGELTNASSSGAAAAFTSTVSGNKVQFKTTDTGSLKYLAFRSGQGLVLSDTAFSWTRSAASDGGVYSYSYTTGGKTWYIAYDDGWKVVVITGNTINCIVGGESHILSANRDLDGLVDGDANSYLSLWQINYNEADQMTTISLDYNGRTYYLGGDTTLELATLSGASTTWSRDTAGTYFITTEGGTRYFIVYTNGWKVKTSDKYSIIYNDGTKNHYLAYNVTGVKDKTLAGADAAWTIQNPGKIGYITITIDDTVYYLSQRNANDLVLQTNVDAVTNDDKTVTPAAVKWQINGVGIYTEIDGYNYYIVYDGAWHLQKVYKTISSEGIYLAYDVSSKTVKTSTSASDANIRWQFDTNSLWMVGTDGKKYYLTFKGENETPRLSTTENDGWKIEDDYITTANGEYYLNWFYEKYNGNTKIWITRTTEQCYLISNGSGNYLYLDDDLYQGQRTSDQYRCYQIYWRYDSSNHFYMYYRGTKYYLGANYALSNRIANHNFPMVTDVNQAVKWYFDTDELGTGIYYIVTENARSYIYLGKIPNTSTNTWTHGLKYFYNFSSGSNYLGRNGNTVTNLTSGSADGAKWQINNGSKLAIYQLDDDGNAKYLSVVNEQLTITDNNSGLNWYKDSTGYYVTSSGVKLYLMYEPNGGAWTVRPLTGFKITDFEGENYLCYNGSGFYNTTDQASATLWYCTGTTTNPNKVYTYIGTTKQYITYSSGNLATTSTKNSAASWEIQNDTLYSSGNWIVYAQSTWKIDKDPDKFYIAYKVGTDYNFLTTYADNTSKIDKATEFKFSNSGKIYPDGDITVNGSQWYINRWGTFLTGWDRSWTNTNGVLKCETGYYVNFDPEKSKWSSSETYYEPLLFVVYGACHLTSGSISNNVSVAKGYENSTKEATANAVGKITKTDDAYKSAHPTVYKLDINDSLQTGGYGKPLIAPEGVDALTITAKTLPKPSLVLHDLSLNTSVKTIDTKAQEFDGPTIETGQDSGIATYFPLKLASQTEDDPTNYYDDYRADSKNTGYVIAGANERSSYYRSDIRVSNYDTSDIYKAINASGTPTYSETYDSRLQVITKTYLSGGQYVRIKDSRNKNCTSVNSQLASLTQMTWQDLGLEKYEFEDTDTVKKNDTLSRAGFAEMLMGGNDVYGLHFMDATISASNKIIADQVMILGNTYYNYELPEDSIDFKVKSKGAINFFSGTYFSSTVTSFFSLHEVFRNDNQVITAIKEIKKIYKVNGISNYVYLYADGTYSREGVASKIASATMLFDTDWITNPGTLIQNAVYYFEIPVNRGEYALGSVEGGIGAYLLYLDIALNGNSVADDRVSHEGNGVSTKYTVDYRVSPDVCDNCSLLQFAFDAPAGATEDTFSVNVTFDNSAETVTDRYPNGLYTIRIVNLTNTDVQLTMFVCDNDDDVTNEYPYAYQIIYTNATNNETILEYDDVTTFKSCYEFTIPWTGVPN